MAPLPMTLTLVSAKARRQGVLDAALPEFVRQGKTAERAIHVEIPGLIARAENNVLNWLLNLDETDYRRLMALAGFISENYVAWQVDALMWDMIHFGGDDNNMDEVRELFTEEFPTPKMAWLLGLPGFAIMLQTQATTKSECTCINMCLTTSMKLSDPHRQRLINGHSTRFPIGSVKLSDPSRQTSTKWFASPQRYGTTGSLRATSSPGISLAALKNFVSMPMANKT
ncbi:hypothetical protein PG997_005659 [Apiospora hydei]|uniref:Uncharacterized protein n=1 Tax=Apiospora hydei TaxID=1337664 RepID=A0ABR1WLK0_9PEZI